MKVKRGWVGVEGRTWRGELEGGAVRGSREDVGNCCPELKKEVLSQEWVTGESPRVNKG